MKIDQHPFPTNMLDAMGKTKVLMSEAAERSARWILSIRLLLLMPKERV